MCNTCKISKLRPYIYIEYSYYEGLGDKNIVYADFVVIYVVCKCLYISG